jgi:hypothetical protein
MTNIRFKVRFGPTTAPLVGEFLTIEKARWFAEQECDGMRYTIHRVSLPEVQVS